MSDEINLLGRGRYLTPGAASGNVIQDVHSLKCSTLTEPGCSAFCSKLTLESLDVCAGSPEDGEESSITAVPVCVWK